MDLQEMRDYVRVHLDLEIDDLPDTLLDVWIRDGSRRIERSETRWPFYENVWTLTTVPGQHTYVKTLAIGTDLDQIANLSYTDSPRLLWVGMDEIQELQRSQPSSSSRPVYFAEWGPDLTLFPTPDQVYSITVRGYRKATDWVANGSGAEPDFPIELHNVVATFALSKAYAQQEDPEMSGLYERQFSDELNEFRRRLNVAPYPQPTVIGGGPLTQRARATRPLYSYPGGVF